MEVKKKKGKGGNQRNIFLSEVLAKPYNYAKHLPDYICLISQLQETNKNNPKRYQD